ncbi:MAG: hypothetical protein Q8S00_32450 [Deltaproteobacteria bacterium]|nr:hypothetical protein [Deltaproteobacteria bacterium]
MILSIDPGVRQAGAALFENGELTTAWLSKGDKEIAGLVTWPIATAWAVFEDIGAHTIPDAIQHLVMEIPYIYPAQFQKGDQQDIIQVALMNGALAGLFLNVPGAEIVTYLPKQWKGQVPKDTMIERIKSKLDTEELSRVQIVEDKKHQKDIWDAVGVGLKYVGRL